MEFITNQKGGQSLLWNESRFKATWLDGHFAPRTWNYHQHEGPRTNNHLEGWHNHLKRTVRKAHPDLYEFIEIIQREQAATEVTIQQLEGGGRLQAKRRKAVQHEENIKRLTDDFLAEIEL